MSDDHDDGSDDGGGDADDAAFVRVTLDALEVAVEGRSDDSLDDVANTARSLTAKAVAHAETLTDENGRGL